MAESESSEAEEPKKKSKLPLILGGVLAILLGAGGFFATYTGMIGGPSTSHAAVPKESETVDFVPIPPVVIALGPAASARHLRFIGDLEVVKGEEGEILHLMPRILDVLNTYLRAVEVAEFNDPPALARLRSQMLRRVQIVTGEGRVRDLLITEFVIN